MPRQIIITNPTNYKGYKLNPKYSYDKQQLNTIIKALEYYSDLSSEDLNSNYMVFDVTIQLEEPTTINDDVFSCDDGGYEFLEFNYNDLTKLLDRKHFYYRYSKEISPKYGRHCHLMVIGNHVSLNFLLGKLKLDIENLDGVKTAYISPRKFNDDLLVSHKSPERKHFHYLKRSPDHKDGLNDCVFRMGYRAKVDQKPKYMTKNYRSFDGTRKLKPLLPRSEMSYNKSVARRKRAKNDDVFDLSA
ncbi:hypothetical protein [Acinetobacter sp. HY1485]|uniref:hypothetical protein n=1 Tax=Acinetobacter sp. HY1485 TaxID=2970918 RepID=UPI0022B96412|nr:hypothetical protein [Acinetobacter sp. HY1485]